MPVASTSRCAAHPDVAAVEICTRCGAFTCAACLEYSDTAMPQPYCAGCFRRELAQQASGRAVGALVVALVVMTVLAVVVGLVVAAVLREK